MANYLFRMLAQAEGYCCEYSYLEATSLVSAKDLSDRLGITTRAIEMARKKKRNGVFQACPLCTEKRPEHPLQVTARRIAEMSQRIVLDTVLTAPDSVPPPERS